MLPALVRQSERVRRSGHAPGRLRAPGDLVARMRRRFPEFGITRLAEITNLDEVGFPVWAAIRPAAPTLSVCQGKGATAEAAQASAVMEAVELSMAERRRPDRIASAEALTAEDRHFDPLPAHLRRGCRVFDRDRSIGWVEGHDIAKGGTVWLPLQAVRVDASEPDRRYWQSTDGVGSGSLMVEGVMHGLLERIERDAVELSQLRSDEEISASCLDLEGLDDPTVSALARTVSEAGLHLRAFEITSDLDVPVVFATVSPRLDGAEGRWRHFDLASGSAARLTLAEAALAAVGEALQSRLTTISGARDDIQPEAFGEPIAPDLLVYPRATPSHVPSPAKARTHGTELEEVLARLRAASIGSVIVVPLHEDEDFAAAKLVVPGLELPSGSRSVPHGQRLHRAIEALQ